MPGILNAYFPLPACALNVQSMTSAPVAYALGRFRRRLAGGRPGDVFTGLVRGTRVRDVSALGTVNDLLADWDAAQRRLAGLAAPETDEASHADQAGEAGEAAGGWDD